MTYDPPFHSIIGDRGKGDTPDSSDGVVPYWSSHLDGAESEVFVPAGHGATNHRATVAEVTRILYHHLAPSGSPARRAPGQNANAPREKLRYGSR